MVNTSSQTEPTIPLLEVESFLILRAVKSVYEDQGLHLSHDRFTHALEAAFDHQRIRYRAARPDRYLCFGTIEVQLLHEAIQAIHCESLRRELQRLHRPAGLILQIGPDRLDCRWILA